jgi:hypothetical protein
MHIEKGQLAFAIVVSLSCWAADAWAWKSLIQDKKSSEGLKAKMGMQLCLLTCCVLMFTIGSIDAAFKYNKP